MLDVIRQRQNKFIFEKLVNLEHDMKLDDSLSEVVLENNTTRANLWWVLPPMGTVQTKILLR